MNKIYNYIKLVRPLNCFITALVVFVGGIISLKDNTIDGILLFASFTAAIVAASGNVINDYFDIDIDKIAHPQRPLAAGKINPAGALTFYSFLVFISAAISLLLKIELFIITISALIVLFIYSLYLKRIPLVGNVTVATLTALAFLFGGTAVENIKVTIIPAVFAFLINLIRELVKDSEDIKGDSSSNVITFPIRFGMTKTRTLVTILILFLIGFTFYPFVTRLYCIEYFVIVMLLVNPLMVYSLKKLFSSEENKSFHQISSILKLNMILGLIAIYLGK